MCLLVLFIEPCCFFLVKFAEVLVSYPASVLAGSLFMGHLTNFKMAIDYLKWLLRIHGLQELVMKETKGSVSFPLLAEIGVNY